MNVKSYEVDIDSLDDCKRLLKIAQSLIGQLRVSKHGTRREQSQEVFDACMSIYNTDISSVYAAMKLDTAANYYVYIHADPNNRIVLNQSKSIGKVAFSAAVGLTHLPFYVGKGTGNRAYELNRNDSHKKVRQRIRDSGKDVVVHIVKDNMTEIEALMLESKLIDIYGLITKGGKLVNLDEGINSEDRRRLYKPALSVAQTFYKNSV